MILKQLPNYQQKDKMLIHSQRIISISNNHKDFNKQFSKTEQNNIQIHQTSIYQPMKIFISSIDTELGYHLTECLRQDHLLLQGYSIISGTRSNDAPSFLLHDSAHQTFDFSKQRDTVVKNAVQSDVLIFDLRNDPAPQVQFILKVLKHYQLKKPLKVIGISNYMTWSNSKTTEFCQIPHDKQALLQHTINKHHWKNTHLNKSHYPLRVPHPMFVYNYLLEEQIMQLKNYQQMIHPTIFCTGLLYGKSGFDFREHMETAVNGGESWVMNLKSNKMISEESLLPILHVDRLMENVQTLIYSKEENRSQEVEEYSVLCEDKPKSIVKIVQIINGLCGNTKQITQQKRDSIKQQKFTIDSLKLPSPPNQYPSTIQLTNEISTRSAVFNQNNISSAQSSSISETQLTIFTPELNFAKDKTKFSLLMNINFSQKNETHQKKTKKHQRGKDSDDTYVGRENQESNMDDSMTKIRDDAQKDSQKQKKWLQPVIEEFAEYYDCEFKHFILSEELLKEQENTQRMTNSMMSRYFLINKNVLAHELSILIQNGVIPQERLATPEEDKKKPTNSKNPQSRQSTRKQSYEIVFPEVIQHVLSKNKLSHFVICLKSQMITKLLTLLNESGFEQLKEMKFINITGKDSRPNTPSIPLNQSISKSIQIFSDDFYNVYDLQNPNQKIHFEGQRIQLDEDEIKKSAQKSRKQIQPPKDTDEGQEHKINLIHQYLLDNLIVYIAEAKNQLKLKGKLKIGQKFEGKQNIKLFIEELKNIKTRQMKLDCEEQQ